MGTCGTAKTLSKVLSVESSENGFGPRRGCKQYDKNVIQILNIDMRLKTKTKKMSNKINENH